MGKKAQPKKKKKPRKPNDDMPCRGKVGSLPDWSGLPDLVLHSILIRAPTIPDFFASGGVCRTWRAVWKYSGAGFSASQSPLLLLPHKKHPRFFSFYGVAPILPPKSFSFYSLAHGRSRLLVKSNPDIHDHYCIGFSYGYIILANEFHHILLINPFTNASIAFPRARRVFPDVSYPIKFGLLTAPPSHPSSNLLLFSRPNHTFQFCPMGGNGWTVHGSRLRVIGVTTVRNVVHVLTGSGRIATIDFTPRPRINLLAVAPVLDELEPYSNESELYLVESDGQLLVASVYYDWLCTHKEMVSVYRLDMAQSTWVGVQELGDRAMFLGSLGSGVSMAPEAWGGKQNCVYYVDKMSVSGTGLLRWKAFNLREGRAELFDEILPYWYGGVYLFSPVWVFPRLCY